MGGLSSVHVAVIGAGTMGRGIATAALWGGHTVALYDSEADVLAAAMSDVRGRSRRGDDPTSVSRLMPARAVEEAVQRADVVIETVTEVFDVKVPVLALALDHAPTTSLVASNTSTMSIGRLDDAAGGTRRLVGMHFFNPAEKMQLLEIAVRSDTPGSTVRRCESFATGLGKTAIIVQDRPGFVTSRLGLILGNEAMRLLEDGAASATAIDTAMRLGYNHPMGPLELADLVGLDARLNNLRALHESSGDDRLRPLPVLVDAVARGHLGRKTRRGFYNYDAAGRRLAESVMY